MSDVSRHHHFLPQCYLKGFAKDVNGKPRLHVINIVEQKPFETHPRNVGAQRDFNRVDVDGLAMDAFEKGFSKFEGQVAPVLVSMEKSGQLPSDPDMTVLINLIAMLAVRNPQIRGNIERSQNEHMKRDMGLALPTLESFEAIKKRMKEAGQEVDDEVTYDDIRRFLEDGNYDVVYDHGYHLQLELEVIDAILPYLFDRKWSLFVSEDGGDFVCSDHPVVIVSTVETGGHSYGVGFGMTNTEITMPINRKMAISGTFEGESKVYKVGEDVVAAINGRTISSAEKQIYSYGPDFNYLTGDGLKHSSHLLK